MSKPYALLSDLHFHEWNSFATTNDEGVNSRLQVIIDEVCRAKDELIKAGGDTMILAGDIFHTRGSISPEVLNPVIRLFENLTKDIKVYAIPGNHDLATKDAAWLSNAASALEPAGVAMCHESGVAPEPNVLMVPWFSSVEALKAELEDLAPKNKSCDLVIHAPVDGVIGGLPDHGLTDTYLSSLGFKRVFSGHYHSHKDFGNGVYSIGATTHQTWSDVGSKAGFLLVYPDRVQRFASHAPSFVDIYGDMDEEELMTCDGNFVRCKIGKATPAEINDIRQDLLSRGAKGVVIQAVKESSIEAREAGVSPKSVSLEQSVSDYVSKTYAAKPELTALCADILTRVDANEDN